MLDSDDPRLPADVVMSTRILWGALIVAQLATAVVLATLTARGASPKGPHSSQTVMIFVALAVLFGAVLVTIGVRRLFRFDSITSDTGIRGRYTNRTIVPMAALEAAGFTGMIFVFLSGKWMPLGIVPVVALVIQFALFPRRRLPGAG